MHEWVDQQTRQNPLPPHKDPKERETKAGFRHVGLSHNTLSWSSGSDPKISLRSLEIYMGNSNRRGGRSSNRNSDGCCIRGRRREQKRREERREKRKFDYLMENLGSWVSSRPELNRSTSGKASLSEALSSLPFSWEISQGHGGSGGGFSTDNICKTASLFLCCFCNSHKLFYYFSCYCALSSP